MVDAVMRRATGKAAAVMALRVLGNALAISLTLGQLVTLPFWRPQETVRYQDACNAPDPRVLRATAEATARRLQHPPQTADVCASTNTLERTVH